MRYQVSLTRTDVTYATVDVEAGSPEEARAKVEKMLQAGEDPEDDDEDVVFGSWEVDGAAPVKGPVKGGGAEGAEMALEAQGHPEDDHWG